MCKIQVRSTADEEWSIVKVRCEEPLPDHKSEETVKDHLSKISGKSETAERGEAQDWLSQCHTSELASPSLQSTRKYHFNR